MPFDTFDAQRINPSVAGTYRDTPEDQARRQERIDKVGGGLARFRSKPRTKAWADAKRAQRQRNHATRSALYSSMDGSIRADQLPEWHATINALQQGTA